MNRILSLAFAAAMLALPGCESTSAPAAADVNQAKQTLERALTAWAKGATVAAIKGESPSIVISDPRWERGDVLKKYEIKSDGKPSGAEQVFTVALWFDDPKSGKEVSETVSYRVGTNPMLTVFRALF